MGIKGLWQLLEPTSTPVRLEALSNQIVAIDASIWLYQAIKVQKDGMINHHINLFLKRLCKLLYYDIRPVFVFDGPNVPEVKKQVLQLRRNKEHAEAEKIELQRSRVVNAKLRDYAQKVVEGKATVDNDIQSGANDKKLTNTTDDKDFIFDSSSNESESGEEDEEFVYDLPSLYERIQRLCDRHQLEKLTKYELEMIDIDSVEFQRLNAQDQMAVLQELRSRLWHKPFHDIYAGDDEDQDGTSSSAVGSKSIGGSIDFTDVRFSKRQVEGIVKRSRLTRKMHSLSNINDRYVKKSRIASNQDKEYILVKNINNSTWTMQPKVSQIQSVDTSNKSSVGKRLQAATIDFNDEFNNNDADRDDRATEIRTHMGNDDKLISIYQELMLNLPDNTTDDDEQFIQDALYTWSQSELQRQYTQLKTRLQDNQDQTDSQEKQLKQFLCDALLQIAFAKDVILNEPRRQSRQVESRPQSSALFESVDYDLPDISQFLGIEQEKSITKDQPSVQSDNGQQFHVESQDQRLNVDDFVEIKDKEVEDNFGFQQEHSMDIPGDADFALRSSLSDDIDDEEFSVPATSTLQYTEARGVDTIQKNDLFMEQMVQNGKIQMIKIPDENLLQQSHPAIQQSSSSIDALLIDRQKQSINTQTSVTSDMVVEVQELLNLFGVPFLIAPGEAEAQCVQLQKIGLVDGIISDDSDVFAFGATKVYRNFYNQAKFLEYFSKDDIERHLCLTVERIIFLAYLLGCDYTDGVGGIGVVGAMEVLAEFDSSDMIGNLAIFQSICTGERDVPAEYQVVIDSMGKAAMQKYQFPPRFPDRRVLDAYLHPEVDNSSQEFQWQFPKLDKLRHFLTHKLLWTVDKVDSIVVPVLKSMSAKKSIQTNLNQYIISSPSHSSSLKLKPRIQKAVDRLSSHNDVDKDDDSKQSSSLNKDKESGQSVQPEDSTSTEDETIRPQKKGNVRGQSKSVYKRRRKSTNGRKKKMAAPIKSLKELRDEASKRNS
ncbi:hypothetical protein MIR68_004511 [Amoeboaphelidium protococcarum]|nr:hypothetical protein MIR68_004511 [Amoeboaphelidium protococcarum]